MSGCYHNSWPFTPGLYTPISLGSTSQKVTYWHPVAGSRDLPILKAPPAGPNKLVWLLFTVQSQFPSCSLSVRGGGPGRLRGFEVNGCFYFLTLETGLFLGSCSIVLHRLLVSLGGPLPHTYPRVHKLGLMLGVSTQHIFLSQCFKN